MAHRYPRARSWLGGLLIPLLLGVTTVPAASACLNRAERRHVIASGKVVKLAEAIRSARSHYHGDVVRARLCRRGRGYVYRLTVLARNGKVSSVSVDANTGRLIGAH